MQSSTSMHKNIILTAKAILRKTSCRIGPCFLYTLSSDLVVSNVGVTRIFSVQSHAYDLATRLKRRMSDLPDVHVFHAHGNITVVHECAIEAYNVFGVAVVHILHLPHDLPPNHQFGIHLVFGVVDSNKLCSSRCIRIRIFSRLNIRVATRSQGFLGSLVKDISRYRPGGSRRRRRVG
jgi:hypothetical protein